MLLESDGFLTELTKMYERQKVSGTVWVTLKRSCLKRLPKRGLTGEGTPSAATILDPQNDEWVVLARATDGKKKISTTVPLAKADRFNKSMTLIQKAHMDGLKETVKKSKKREGGKKKA
ncbi:signal recognition particle subunit SRP14 [bacterium]|jgi:signal recognition particle subunit SRP14|nr:signal recognition particle subunit SRP14 [bacterium]|tara:strand:- start:23556 stop:23912 length:357 start_codon:yes stop_codon:yes gene_type:complete